MTCWWSAIPKICILQKYEEAWRAFMLNGNNIVVVILYYATRTLGDTRLISSCFLVHIRALCHHHKSFMCFLVLCGYCSKWSCLYLHLSALSQHALRIWTSLLCVLVCVCVFSSMCMCILHWCLSGLFAASLLYVWKQMDIFRFCLCSSFLVSYWWRAIQ